jgi:hypothetical protein
MKVTFAYSAADDAYEPNNQRQQASRIAINELIKHKLIPAGDRDWFRIKAPEAGYLWLEPAGDWEALGALTPRWHFENARGRLIGRAQVIHLAGPSEVWLRMKHDLADESSPTPIRWRVRFKREVDLMEPNDAPWLAAALSLNEWTRAALAPRDDRDHFHLTVQQPGWLKVETSDLPDGVRVGGALLDARGQKTLARGLMVRVQPGEYVYRLRPRSEPAIEPFSVRFRFLPEDDELMPTASGPAKLVPRSEPYQLSLFHEGDEDRWRFNAPSDGHLELSAVSLPPGGKPRLRIEDKAGDLVFTGRMTANHTARLTPIQLNKGSYTVTFSDDADDWQAPPARRYRVRARFSPAVDAHEPNDDVDHATALVVGQRMQVQIYGSEDEDWFTFDVDSPGFLRLGLDNVGAFAAHEAIDLDLSLMRIDEHGKHHRVGGRLEPPYQSPLVIDLAKPGRYLLRVRSLHDGFDAEPFGLTVAHFVERPTPPPHGGPVAAMVGLELSNQAKKSYERISRRTGALLLQADDVGMLDTVMKEAVTEAVAAAEAGQGTAEADPGSAPPGEASSGRWPMVVAFVLVAALLAGGIWWWRRRQLGSGA